MDSGYQQLGQDNRPDQYGDDVGLDALWDACDAGDGEACLDLYDAAPWGSGYEGFAERNMPDQYGDAVSLLPYAPENPPSRARVAGAPE